MGLNDEERKTIVKLEMEKADRFLKQAGMMCDLEQLREKGDYNCIFDVTKDELLSFVDPAQELIAKIKQLVQ